MTTAFHQHYLTLVEEVERRFPVSAWKSGDVDIWPLARMDLYLDMYWQHAGGKPASARPRAVRALALAARPLTNIWKRRNDLRHHIGWPRPAHAIFLGDGVSLDRVGGAWQDRYCEPLIAALESQGRRSFLMQCGELRRYPWHRPTYAANVVEMAGRLLAPFHQSQTELPSHEEFLHFLCGNGVAAPSLSAKNLARRANVAGATASAFEQVLRTVKPRIAFVVTYYAGLGHAFLLACRRQGIPSIDLQHCPQGGRHKAYRWSAVPETGYTTLPSIFWNWTAEDAAVITSWTAGSRWHRSIHGGHPRFSTSFDGDTSQVGPHDKPDRQILVALQTVDGHRKLWSALADQIDAAPPSWRWWLRRHPASRKEHDAYFDRLLSLRRPNVVIEEASTLPLPALLRHMSVVVSLASGTAVEASAYGVPAVFLSDDARGPFGDIIDAGHATIVDDLRNLNAMIAALPETPSRPRTLHQPDMIQTLTQLNTMAGDYAKLCALHRGK